MFTKPFGCRWLSAALVTVLATSAVVSLAQEKKPDAPKPAAKAKTLVDVAKHTPELATFAKLVEAAGLTETLSGKGPFTVLAPTDEVFAKLGKEKLADLQKPENKAQLVKILKNHVVDGKHLAAAIEKMTTVKTLAGEELAVKVKDGVVTIGTAKVTKADIAADNGVIHLVDAVQMPK